MTQLDPSGRDAHYVYAGNNPTNYVDPTGLDFWDLNVTINGPFGLGGTVGVNIDTSDGFDFGLYAGASAGTPGASFSASRVRGSISKPGTACGEVGAYTPRGGLSYGACTDGSRYVGTGAGTASAGAQGYVYLL